MPGGASDGIVLGVDIGTTSTKVVAFDALGLEHGAHSVDYDLHEPTPGWAVQDPDVIHAAVVDAVRQVSQRLADRGLVPVGISFSSAMHSIIGLDAAGRPLTPSVTWADGRSASQADRLRGSGVGRELHQRSGTPVHPMSPVPKLMWFAENEPALFAAARRWVGIKEYVLAQLTGDWVVDHSVASASGLLESATLDWYDDALAVTGVRRDQLSTLVPTRQKLRLRPDAASALGVPVGVPVVVGAADGPLANLGVGAVRPGVAACSIGTSGALRVTVERPAVDARGTVYCYALTENRWVVGGAINNGGVVLAWTGDALAPDLVGGAEELLALAARVPAGCGGLVMLPYLLSERAPHWTSLPRGAYVGLTRGHRREHLVRAALEGVCQQLALVLHSMRDAGNDIREIRATGGFSRSPLWRQMLTDVLDADIGYPAGHEGSSFGAALLGIEALGLVGSIDVAADLVRIEQTSSPDPRAAATYRSLLPVFSSLYDALLPTFTTLARLSPLLPLDPPESSRPRLEQDD